MEQPTVWDTIEQLQADLGQALSRLSAVEKVLQGIPNVTTVTDPSYSHNVDLTQMITSVPAPLPVAPVTAPDPTLAAPAPAEPAPTTTSTTTGA